MARVEPSVRFLGIPDVRGYLSELREGPGEVVRQAGVAAQRDCLVEDFAGF